MVGVERVELPTPAMSIQCSTTELYARTIVLAVAFGGGPASAKAKRRVSERLRSVQAIRAEYLPL